MSKNNRGPRKVQCACTVETIRAGLLRRGLDTGTRGQPLRAPKWFLTPVGVILRGGVVMVCEDCGQPFLPVDEDLRETVLSRTHDGPENPGPEGR